MNGPYKHGALIELPGGGHAFVDGIPDTCDHDYSDSVYQTASGKWIFWYTYRQWAHLPTKDRDRLINELHNYHQEPDDPIVFGTTQCRKCKKIYEPEMF
jgi:hypothetical protein